jgi:hypothetical protein
VDREIGVLAYCPYCPFLPEYGYIWWRISEGVDRKKRQ